MCLKVVGVLSYTCCHFACSHVQPVVGMATGLMLFLLGWSNRVVVVEGNRCHQDGCWMLLQEVIVSGCCLLKVEVWRSACMQGAYGQVGVVGSVLAALCLQHPVGCGP